MIVTMVRITGVMLVTIGVSYSNFANAWDPWGDIQNPGRIIDNTKRTVDNTVKTVGDAVQQAAPVIATISCPGCAALVNALPNDQKKLVETIVTRGMIITTLTPVIGTYYLTALNARTGDVYKNDVPVQVTDHPPTAKKYSENFMSTACMTQLNDGTVQIYGKQKPDFWDGAKAGDIITAKAAPCPEYNSLQGIKNITSIIFKLTGASFNQLAADSDYKYLMIGTPAAE